MHPNKQYRVSILIPSDEQKKGDKKKKRRDASKLKRIDLVVVEIISWFVYTIAQFSYDRLVFLFYNNMHTLSLFPISLHTSHDSFYSASFFSPKCTLRSSSEPI